MQNLNIYNNFHVRDLYRIQKLITVDVRTECLNAIIISDIRKNAAIYLYFIFSETEILRNIYDTVLNHNWDGTWYMAKQTYLICEINYNDFITIQNLPKGNGDVHAEELLIALVKEIKGISKTKRQKICLNMFMNNSPCSSPGHNCTDKLIAFLNKYERVHLTLIVANLYNICRKSCKDSDEDHIKSKRLDTTHTANYIGLRNLMLHERCDIKAFSKSTWERLVKKMDVIPEVKKYILDYYTIQKEGNDRSREIEDKLIKKDLEYIRRNALKK